jgi:hypothetical protein
VKLTKTFVFLAAASSVAAQDFCSLGDFNNTWRVLITVTDGIYKANAPFESLGRDTVIDLRSTPRVIHNGQLTPGESEFVVNADFSPVWATRPDGTYAPTCTAHLLTYSLWQENAVVNGKLSLASLQGPRIGLYVLTVNPNDGSLTGKVQFRDTYYPGTPNVTNGTLSGKTISSDISLASYSNDPFWLPDSGNPPPGPTCAQFPANFVPFTSVNYVSARNAAGDRLLVGSLIQQDASNIQAILNLPLPEFTNEQYCGTVTLASGYSLTAYVPTAAERTGDFHDFAGVFIDPVSDTPFPGGFLPQSRIGSIFAWRVR